MSDDITQGIIVPKAIQLFAGNRNDGSEVFESVLAEQLSETDFRLLKTPGLVIGLAKDDAFQLMDSGRYKISRRGGNLAIQFFFPSSVANPKEFALEQLTSLGASLDGEDAQLLVFSIPVAEGFPQIEERLNRITQRFPGLEWYYGNVYDPADGVTPLNWWISSP